MSKAPAGLTLYDLTHRVPWHKMGNGGTERKGGGGSVEEKEKEFVRIITA